jgi:hypothetical protein
MGPAKSQELIRYFKDRRAWLVDADSHPPKLQPYRRWRQTLMEPTGNQFENPGGEPRRSRLSGWLLLLPNDMQS